MDEDDSWPNFSLDVYANTSEEETDIQPYYPDNSVLPVTFGMPPSYQQCVYGNSPYYIFNYGSLDIHHHGPTERQPPQSFSDGSPYIVDLPLTPPLSSSSECNDENSVYTRSSQGSDIDTVDATGSQRSGFTIANGEQDRFVVNSVEDELHRYNGSLQNRRVNWAPMNIITLITMLFTYWFVIKYFD